MTTDSVAEKRALVESVESWWHSIDLGDGIVTEGHKTSDYLSRELAALRLPPLERRAVLDIGAWDGFYSFEAERRGASRVVALDWVMWGVDWPKARSYFDRCSVQGVHPRPIEEVPELWSSELPGKRAFDVAHEVLRSSVEPLVTDFMTTDLNSLGRFDVVLFLGVIYHQRHLLLALERLRQVTGELAIIESHAAVFPGFEQLAMCQFVQLDELGGDPTNWWVPNLSALVSLCHSAGFSLVNVTQGPPSELLGLPRTSPPGHYRAILHARP